MLLPESFALNTGYSIPAVGLGTWQSKPNEVRLAVETALKIGYRHIDAASVYGNEVEVGEGIKASGVDRKDIFIHFPISFPHLPEAFPVNPETEEIWVTDVPLSDTLKAMEGLLKTGKVRSIGVSNFTRQKIEGLMKTSKVLPAVNQIEGHPYLQQPALLDWHKSMVGHTLPPFKREPILISQGIVTVSYSPMGNNIYNLPRCVDDPEIISIARELGKEPAQVLISWAVQRGSVVLPKSVTASRIKSNFEVFELPRDKFEQVGKMDRHSRYNFPARIGVDMFDEVDQATLRQKVEEWKAQKRQIRVAT